MRFHTAWVAGVLIGTQNDPSATKSWNAGWAVGGDADYGTSVSNLVADIWDEHKDDDKNQKLTTKKKSPLKPGTAQ